MSKSQKKLWMSIALAVTLLLTLSVVAQEEIDEILNHYQKRASEVFNGRNPILSNIQFSFDATTYLKVYNNDNVAIIIDSTIAQYFYSLGNLDSIITKVVPEEKIDSLDINYPNVFLGEYNYNFYPNDTGGEDIAIGYDSYEFDPTVPVGIAIIDRENYFLTHLYMHFMNYKSIDRTSKSFRFKEIEGYVFPDSVWELKSRRGIFSAEYYRIETGINNIEIHRKVYIVK